MRSTPAGSAQTHWTMKGEVKTFFWIEYTMSRQTEAKGSAKRRRELLYAYNQYNTPY